MAEGDSGAAPAAPSSSSGSGGDGGTPPSAIETVMSSDPNAMRGQDPMLDKQEQQTDIAVGDFIERHFRERSNALMGQGAAPPSSWEEPQGRGRGQAVDDGIGGSPLHRELIAKQKEFVARAQERVAASQRLAADTPGFSGGLKANAEKAVRFAGKQAINHAAPYVGSAIDATATVMEDGLILAKLQGGLDGDLKDKQRDMLQYVIAQKKAHMQNAVANAIPGVDVCNTVLGVAKAAAKTIVGTKGQAREDCAKWVVFCAKENDPFATWLITTISGKTGAAGAQVARDVRLAPGMFGVGWAKAKFAK